MTSMGNETRVIWILARWFSHYATAAIINPMDTKDGELHKAANLEFLISEIIQRLRLDLKIHWKLIFCNVMRCSIQRIWVGCFIYFKFIPVFFVLVKEINRVISKRISSIYSKVTIETYSTLRFCKFKKLISRLLFGELQLTQISLNFKTPCCYLKIKGLGVKAYAFSLILFLKRIMMY